MTGTGYNKDRGVNKTVEENISRVFQTHNDFDLLHCIKYVWTETSKEKKEKKPA